MAIVTKGPPAAPSADFDANGVPRVRCEYDYNDQNGRLLRFRCINGSPQAAAVWVVNPTSGARAPSTPPLVCPANQTTEVNIPPGQADQFGITIRLDGRIDGVEWHWLWPYDGGPVE